VDIKQLKIFCTVADKNSFSLAAEVLDLTQPTISFQIASLEQELGTRLFDRGGRNTSLTKSGEVLYRYAVQIIDLTVEAQQAIDRLQGLLSGEITLGASTIPGAYILPPLLKRFKENYSGIDIRLIVGDTREITARVLHNELEIGVVGASEKSDHLVFDRFVTDNLVLAVPAHTDWFASDTVTLEALRQIPFVMREEGSGTRTIMERKLAEVGLGIEDLNIVMTLGSTAAVKGAVESGAGASIVSQRAVQNEIKLGTVKVIGIEGIELGRDFFVVHRKHKVLSPAAEALLDFLKEHGNIHPPEV